MKRSIASKIAHKPDHYVEPERLKFISKIAPKTASRIVKVVFEYEKPVECTETFIKFAKLLRFNDALYNVIITYE